MQCATLKIIDGKGLLMTAGQVCWLSVHVAASHPVACKIQIWLMATAAAAKFRS